MSDLKPIFADTSYWVAVIDPTDQLRRTMLAVTKELRPRQLVTSEWVLLEVLNMFTTRGPHYRRLAAETVRSIQASPGVRVEPGTPALFMKALTLYEHRLDKYWSVTDCGSILLMEEHGLTQILTHDHHFEQAGFRCLLRR